MEELKRIVLNTQETEEDQVTSLSLRPGKLSDFVGQKELVANVRVAIEAAHQRKEPLEHMLFSGAIPHNQAVRPVAAARWWHHRQR